MQGGGTVTAWQPIARVGVPRVRYRPRWSDDLEVFVRTAPRYPTGWQEFFNSKIEELGVHAVYDYSGVGENGVTSYARSDALEEVVEAIDTAIDFANRRYEQEILPTKAAEQKKQLIASSEKTRLQKALEERAARLARPEPT
jgi:hypothetical protein